MRNISGIKKWGRPFFIKKGTTVQPTHLLMDCGRLYIPDTQMSYFYKHLASDIKRGVKNYIIERRTPIFKFHIDIDVFDKEETSYEIIKDWILDVQKIMKEFYPKLSSAQRCVIVCTTDIKRNAIKLGKVFVKVGVHLIWPNIYTNQEYALTLRKAFIQKLEEKHGKRPKWNIWEDVFDDTVYTQNGLRMVGCSKMQRCKPCRGRANAEGICPDDKCNGSGLIDQGRIYQVTDVIDGSGITVDKVLKTLEGDPLKLVLTTSIRTTETNANKQTYPEWFDPNFFEHNDNLFKNNKKKTFYRNTTSLTPEDSAGAKRLHLDNKQKLELDDERFENIQWWFKQKDLPLDSELPEVYRNIQIIDVYVCKGNDESIYYIVRTNCAFCLNYGKEHASNTIYFIINKYGLYQKCFCRCDTTEGRKDGLCKDFRSGAYMIPQDILLDLFPNLRKKYTAIPDLNRDKKMNKTTIDLLYEIKGYELETLFRKLRYKTKLNYERQFASKRK